MRIAFDIASLAALGGAQRQVLEVASGLSERNHEVMLIANKTAGQYAEYPDRPRVRQLHRMSRFDVRVLSDIRRALGEFQPDVCICVSFNATLWGRLAAASVGCRVVVAEHATMAHTPLAIRLTNRLLSPLTESVIACAEAQVDPLCRGGHQRRRIAVVRNGVDVVRFSRDDRGAANVRAELGVPAGAPVIALVAAHRPEKRHDRFISLIEKLHDAGIEAWGVMVGGGPLEERNSAMAQTSRAAQRLVVTGARGDMPAVYSATDVVVLLSDDIETFPLCFLEAQACGVPVVGLDTGGVRETMVEGQTGFVVGREDLDRMCSLVAELLANPVRRADMGRAGRAFVAHELSRDAMIDGYSQVLESATVAHRRG